MRRRLRIILGESIVELGEFLIGTGQMVRDIGAFCLPDYDRRPNVDRLYRSGRRVPAA